MSNDFYLLRRNIPVRLVTEKLKKKCPLLAPGNEILSNGEFTR